jgi:hypothetical protein
MPYTDVATRTNHRAKEIKRHLSPQPRPPRTERITPESSYEQTSKYSASLNLSQDSDDRRRACSRAPRQGPKKKATAAQITKEEQHPN